MMEAAAKALEASIRKWEANSRLSMDDMSVGIADCPLCTLFYAVEDRASCMGCPVFERTGFPYCKQTPYYEVVNAKTDREAHQAAVREVEFLKSLRSEK